jgi:hypothetical protein
MSKFKYLVTNFSPLTIPDYKGLMEKTLDLGYNVIKIADRKKLEVGAALIYTVLDTQKPYKVLQSKSEYFLIDKGEGVSLDELYTAVKDAINHLRAAFAKNEHHRALFLPIPYPPLEDLLNELIPVTDELNED